MGIWCSPHFDQGGEEPGRGVDGVLDLGRGAPALRGPLLEDPDRVAVAVAQVVQLGFLQRRGVRDGDGPRRHVTPGRDARDRGRDLGLVGLEPDGGQPGARLAARRRGRRRDPLDAAVDQVARTGGQQHKHRPEDGPQPGPSWDGTESDGTAKLAHHEQCSPRGGRPPQAPPAHGGAARPPIPPGPLPAIIDELWAQRDELSPQDTQARETVVAAVDEIDAGRARVAHIDPKTDEVVVDERAKQAILLAFRLLPMAASQVGDFRYDDRCRSPSAWTASGCCPARSSAGAPTSRRAPC